MHVWSQLTSLGCAIAGFILALWPRRTSEDFGGEPGQVFWPATSLLRLPVFWAGLALLGYIILQGLNPAWHFVSDADSWWLEPLDPVTWLPTSVEAPFARSNPWRTMIVFGSLFLLVNSVWVGFTRRKSYYAFFVLLAVNAGLLALFGLVQRLSDTPRIFWSYVPSNAGFVASFIYPNHAGPYLYLLVSLAVGLALWHAQRVRKQIGSFWPVAGFVLISAGCSLLVIISNSRMSILLLLAFMLGLSGCLVLRLLQRSGPARSRPEIFPLGLALAAMLCLGIVTLNTDRIRNHFAPIISNPTSAILDRTLPRQAAENMLHDYWLFGWGAGCFQYGFPKYTEKFPEIHYFSYGPRRLWEHAHNDLVEFPVELGVVGMLPLAGILGCAAWQLYRRRFWRNVVSLSLGVGCALILVHAWVDFVFQNPAILLSWSVLLVGALRWLELDQPRAQKRPAASPSP